MLQLMMKINRIAISVTNEETHDNAKLLINLSMDKKLQMANYIQEIQ